MRHALRGRKFNRTTNQRKALLSGLVKDLVKHEQIRTTLPKAKDLRPLVEKMITIGKKGGLGAQRDLISKLGDSSTATKLIKILGERYKDRNGGYTRIIKDGFRHGDNAPMAVIEFVDRDLAAKGTDSGPTAEKDEEDSEE